MAGRARAAGSRRNSAVGPKKQQQQEPWPEEISFKLNRFAMMQAYLLMGVTGIGYLALTWSTVVLLGGFVTVLGRKDFWCLTFISMIQAASLLLQVLAEVLTSKKKPPSEAPERQVSEASGDIEENPLQDDEENQCLEHNAQVNPSEQNETQTAMMELKEALLSLTSVIFDRLIISAEDFDDVARKVAPGEGEFVAKFKTIVEDNCEATANSLRIVKLCGQIAVIMMKRSQYIAHFKDQKFVETLSKASRITCNLESCMLFAGTDGGAKKTARPLLSDLVKEAEALVA